MAANRAAFLDAAGSALRVAEAEAPVPGPNDIVVRNRALAINPLDFAQASKGVMIHNYPAVIGSDVAGEVHRVGENVTRFKTGDRVVGHAWGMRTGKQQDGSFALYTNVPADNAAMIPDNVSYTDAAVLPLAIDTACSGLFQEHPALGLPFPNSEVDAVNKTLVVYGASSSVGSMAVQLATAAGYRVVGIASKKNSSLVTAAGAVAVCDYHDADVVDNVSAAIGSSEFIGAFDAIGTESSHKVVVPLFERFQTGFLACTKIVPELPSTVGSKRVYGVGEFSFPLWQNFVSSGLRNGQLKCLPKPLIVGKGLESLQSALDTYAAGVSGQKVVVEL